MASSCSGIRTATVPLVSPRSHDRLVLARHTTVSAPGQNSSTRSWPYVPRSSTSADAARTVPTSTGAGICLPRPLASSRACTALGRNASAPMPYTVSVGSTTSSPRRTLETASAMPAARSSGSEQSYRRLTAVILSGSSGSCSLRAEPSRHETVPVGEIAPVAHVPPALLFGEHPIDRVALQVAVLHSDDAPGAQQPPGGPLHDPDRVEAVVATAPQRVRRIVIADVMRNVLPFAHRDVRGVADHQVDGAVEVGQRVGEVGQVQPDPPAFVDRLDIAGRVHVGLRIPLNGVHPGTRHLLGEGQRDRAGAGAEIDGDR